jgi:L-fuconolactonase
LEYPWLKGVAGLGPRYLPGDYAAEVAPPAPSRLVFVEADCDSKQTVDEVSWIEHLAAGGVPIAGIVAQVKLDQGKASVEQLGRLRDRPLVRGVRHMLQYLPEPNACASSELIAGARRLAETDWVFDLCCHEGQLEHVIELVRQCPETRFVLDHAGKPSMKVDAFELWKRRIARLGECPNVVCKFSGMSGLADPVRGIAAGVKPFFHVLLAYFGGDRLLYGSDWPVVKLTATLAEWQAAVAELLGPLSDAQRSALMHDNAARVYRV